MYIRTPLAVIAPDLTVGGFTFPSSPSTGLALGAEGYEISNQSRLTYSDIRVVNNATEFLANLGPDRTIICNFTGWHTVSTPINFGYSNLRIVGQAAPGQGFGFTCGANSNNLSNLAGANKLVMEGFRLAPGSEGADGAVDAFRIEGGNANNVFMRNMMFFAGRDQILSTYGALTSDIVIADSIIGPTTSTNSNRGPLFDKNTTVGRVLILRSLLGGNNSRNPLIQIPDGSMVNSVVSGWNGEGATYQSNGNVVSGNMIGNVFIPGPDSNPTLFGGEFLFYDNGGTNFNVYLNDNTNIVDHPDPTSNQVLMCGKVQTGGSYQAVTGTEGYWSTTEVGSLNLTNTLSNGSVSSFVHTNAGPRPVNRDPKAASVVSLSQAGNLNDDVTMTTAELPTLAGGATRIDDSRADKTSAAFRSAFNIPDSTDCRTATDDDGNILMERWFSWLTDQT